RKLLMVIFCLTLSGLYGCAAPAPKTESEAKSLEIAVREMTDQLFLQVQDRWLGVSGLIGAQVVIDPFIDANTAEVNLTSRRIESLVLEECKNRFPKLSFKQMTPESVAAAKYLMTGV